MVHVARICRVAVLVAPCRDVVPTHSQRGSDPFIIQMLVVATRERDAAGAQIEGLRRELSLYLSVPAEGKPRTMMTRVGRMPLATSLSENVNPATVTVAPSVTRSGGFEKHLPPLAEDEMTLDEIM
jgi:hypothetical protein